MNRGIVALLLGLLVLPAVAASESPPASGPNLTAEVVQIPAVGTAGQSVAITLRLINQGTEAAGPFSYRLLAEPDPLPPGVTPAPTDEIFTRRLEAGLAVDEEVELRFDGGALPLVALPNLLRGDRYRFILVVDVDSETGDIDRADNRVYSAGKMATLKPALQLTHSKLDFSFPHGACVLGEAVEVSLELCNTGNAAAVNFQPGVILGEGEFVSFLTDPVAATAPPSCGAPLSQNFLACAAAGAAEVVCAAETCRQSCERDADCAAPLRCLEDRFLDGERSCMASIEAGAACQTFRASGRIPRFDRLGGPHLAGAYRLHFSADARRALSETSPHVVTSASFHCSEPLPDLTVIDLEPALVGVAGEPLAVRRHLRNLGFMPAGQDAMSFEYRYYLAAAGTESSSLAIPLGLQATGGAGVASIGSGEDDLLTDLVMLPSQLPEGSYLLTLVLDPDDRIAEDSKANNRFTVQEPIRIQASSFRIVSRALPAATEGGLYLYQFAAIGGGGALRWSAQGLPAGFTIDAAGLLRGVPREAGIYSFDVGVSAGDQSTSATVALRVDPPRGMLGVASRVLPTAIRGRAYGGFVDAEGREQAGVPLAAVGGIPPYEWTLAPRSAEDRLPQGLVLQAPEGILHGEPSPLSRSSSFVVRVRDSLGAEATALLELQVVADGDLVISSRLFDDGLGAQPYASCVEASGGDRSSGYAWSIEADTIPAGLEFEEREGQGCLLGTPLVCGNYLVETRVSDGAGQSFQTRIPLSIECDVIRISTTFPRAFARGEEVDVELGSNAGAGAVFRRFQGELPPGLSLDEAGRIAGVVDLAAAFGAYDFLVEVRDGSGRQGLNALTIRIQAEPREPVREERERSGCGAAGPDGGGLWAGIAVLFALLLLRTSGSSGKSVRTSWVSTRGPRFRWCGDVGRSTRQAGNIRPIAGLLLVVGLAGCEATTEIVEQPLCQGVVCDGAMECDPADGLCKCDGALCTGGQVCLPDPAPHCGDVSCEFVHCDRGQSCDPETGMCSCQGEVCAEDERCTDAGCVRPSKCEGIQCSGALRCDPDDGQCKCGGEICTQRESCVEGSCVEDRCAGVHCIGAEVCDPADGLCHCGGEGGPICQTGEACSMGDEVVGVEGLIEDAPFFCSISERCDHASCGGGTTCDPVDGSCRCGGVGSLAPACSQEQVCLDGVCRGGSLCESVVCDPGFSCDAADGRCKCGGAGGLRCDEGQVCTADEAGAFGCADACTIQPSGESSCEAGASCYLDRELGHGGAFCAQTGPLQLDDPCAAFNDCGPGLYCSPAKICRRLCHPSEPVEIGCRQTPGAFCLPFGQGESQQPDLGYCIINPG